MLYPGENNAQTWLFFMVLVSWIIAFGDTVEDKILNLKIGFDLTQGSNGAPALRIRDFEDSEYTPRAIDDEDSDEKYSSPRADSLSDSESQASDKISKEAARSGGSDDEENDDDDQYSENDKQRSTRGLKPGEYEPEDNPNIHAKYGSDSDADSM